ncbi:unnamed protein product, partial [Vitis vinifera]
MVKICTINFKSFDSLISNTSHRASLHDSFIQFNALLTSETTPQLCTLVYTLWFPYCRKCLNQVPTGGTRLQSLMLGSEAYVQIVIAGAGGAAHLPGSLIDNLWLPASTPLLAIGVPVSASALDIRLDSLLSIVQVYCTIICQGGVPVAAVASLLAVRMLGVGDPDLQLRLGAPAPAPSLSLSLQIALLVSYNIGKLGIWESKSGKEAVAVANGFVFV